MQAKNALVLLITTLCISSNLLADETLVTYTKDTRTATTANSMILEAMVPHEVVTKHATLTSDPIDHTNKEKADKILRAKIAPELFSNNKVYNVTGNNLILTSSYISVAEQRTIYADPKAGLTMTVKDTYLNGRALVNISFRSEAARPFSDTETKWLELKAQSKELIKMITKSTNITGSDGKFQIQSQIDMETRRDTTRSAKIVGYNKITLHVHVERGSSPMEFAQNLTELKDTVTRKVKLFSALKSEKVASDKATQRLMKMTRKPNRVREAVKRGTRR